MTHPTIERRFLAAEAGPVTVEARAEGEGRMIMGTAAVYYDGTPATEYELWTDFVERIMPGTFDRAISEADDARGLFNHDPNMLLGRVSAGTLTLASTAKGLGYEITPGETQVAADVMVHIERGDLSGSSFAFEVTDQEVRTENGIDIREIRGVKLYDVGPVTYPAYEATEADVRSLRERITSKPDAGGALLRLRLEESQS